MIVIQSLQSHAETHGICIPGPHELITSSDLPCVAGHNSTGAGVLELCWLVVAVKFNDDLRTDKSELDLFTQSLRFTTGG